MLNISSHVSITNALKVAISQLQLKSQSDKMKLINIDITFLSFVHRAMLKLEFHVKFNQCQFNRNASSTNINRKEYCMHA